jgi:carbon-monoxide dehydrogenase medium subunit
MRLPPWAAGRKWAFSEFARRPGDFALAGVALFYDRDREGRACNAHIGVLGACYFPARLSGAERALNGCRVDAETAKAVGAAAAGEADPTDDFHASADYRKALVGTLLERALVAAANRSA